MHSLYQRLVDITMADIDISDPNIGNIDINILYCSILWPTHFPIFTKLSVDRTPLPPPTFHSLRRYHSIDIDSFLADLHALGS